jgi:hypothetical protein
MKPTTIQDLYERLISQLKDNRTAESREGRLEKARCLSIAITELESSQLWFQHSEG